MSVCSIMGHRNGTTETGRGEADDFAACHSDGQLRGHNERAGMIKTHLTPTTRDAPGVSSAVTFEPGNCPGKMAERTQNLECITREGKDFAIDRSSARRGVKKRASRRFKIACRAMLSRSPAIPPLRREAQRWSLVGERLGLESPQRRSPGRPVESLDAPGRALGAREACKGERCGEMWRFRLWLRRT
jgi:hypothetical protein